MAGVILFGHGVFLIGYAEPVFHDVGPRAAGILAVVILSSFIAAYECLLGLPVDTSVKSD